MKSSSSYQTNQTNSRGPWVNSWSAGVSELAWTDAGFTSPVVPVGQYRASEQLRRPCPCPCVCGGSHKRLYLHIPPECSMSNSFRLFKSCIHAIFFLPGPSLNLLGVSKSHAAPEQHGRAAASRSHRERLRSPGPESETSAPCPQIVEVYPVFLRRDQRRQSEERQRRAACVLYADGEKKRSFWNLRMYGLFSRNPRNL